MKYADRKNPPPPKKVSLVTGGAGFIGSNLVDRLIKLGHHVIIIDNLSTGKSGNINKKAIFPNLCDFAEVENEGFDNQFNELKSWLGKYGQKRIDYIFHLGALPRVPLSIEQPLKTNHVNVRGTINILNLAKEVGAKVIYAGSSSIYGNNKTPFFEDMKPDPQSPYALQKLMSEEYCRLYSQIHGIKTVACRFFNVYGKNMAFCGSYVTVMSVWIKQMKANKDITIFGDGNQTRDFTHVSDIVAGLIAAMEHKQVNNFEVYNLGYGNPVKLNKLADLLCGKHPRKYLPKRLGDVDKTYACNGKAREILKWTPKVGIKAGVEEIKSLYLDKKS